MNLHVWWDSLDALLRVLYGIAITSSVVLLAQVVLILVGMGDSGAPDAGGVDASDLGGAAIDGDLSGDIGAQEVPIDVTGFQTLRLFTISGVICFFCVFSWSAIILRLNGFGGIYAVLVGLFPGTAAMYLAAKLIQFAARLSENGTMNLDNAVGLDARVYIPIIDGGAGKVTLTLNGRFAELSATSEGGGSIPTGTAVRVVGVRGDMLIVARNNADGD